MSKPRDDPPKDLLRLTLDQISDFEHLLARLAREIDPATRSTSSAGRSSRCIPTS